MARLTLWGMMQWDNTLFDNIVLPQGMTKQYLIDYIVQEAGDLYPYYQVPPMIKSLSESWFARKLDGFQKMYNALMSEYNPLENYDRYEEGSESPDIMRTETPNITHKRDGTTAMENHSSSTNDSVSNSNSSESSQDDNTNTHSVSAYDKSDYSPLSRDTSNGTGSKKITADGVVQTTNSDNTHASGSDTQTETETGTRTYKTAGTTAHKLRAHGNIGVTTSQQMLQSELELRLYDLYAVIGTLWIDDFIVTIY